MRTIRLLTLLACCLTLPALADGNDHLCVQTHFAHRDGQPLSTIASIKKLGVGWIRDDLLWASVETRKGQYRIPDYVWEWINAAGKHDLKIILTLNGSNGLYSDPFDHDGYVNFARFVAGELRGHVQALELANEPLNGKTRDRAGSYLKTINDAADAINEEAPGAYSIIAPGCSPPLNARLLELGFSPHVDGMALHAYAYSLVPELQPYGDTPGFLERDGIVVGDKAGTSASIIRDLMAISAANHGPGQLWITELGYTTYRPVEPGNFGGFNEMAQAKYAQRQLMECLGTGARLVSWYDSCRRENSPFSGPANFGLIACDGTPTPAYYAIQRLARTMRDWEPQAWGEVRVHVRSFRRDPEPIVCDGSLRETFGTPRSYAFAREDGKRRAVAVWSSERVASDLQPRGADIVIGSDRVVRRVTALDMMSGDRQRVAFRQTGQVVFIPWFTLPDHPVLLFLDGARPAAGNPVTPAGIFTETTGWKVDRNSRTTSRWKVSDGVGELGFSVADGQSGFTAARTTLAIPAGSRYLSFRAMSNADVTLVVRLYDATGQTFQFKLLAVPSNQWECFLVDVRDSQKQNWGGANDGELHFPLQGVAFGLENRVTAGYEIRSSDEGVVAYKDLLILPE